VRGYSRIGSAECRALVEQATADWFGPYLPARLILGDPGRRDASIHAIQVCVPNALLLPVSVERLMVFDKGADSVCTVEARERSHEGDLYTYDVEITDSDGSLLERWDGLGLQVVKGAGFRGSWAGILLAPYLERAVREFFHRTDISIAIERGNGNRRSNSDRAIRRALGLHARIERGPDGKPEAAGIRDVSASHCGSLTLAVTGMQPVACDAEKVVRREPSIWSELLGDARYGLSRLISEAAGEDPDISATRVWTAIECLKKAGAPPNAPLVLSSRQHDGWVSLTSGRLAVTTFAAPVRQEPEPIVFAILAGNAPGDR
jgi:enediyne polyketide synthase